MQGKKEKEHQKQKIVFRSGRGRRSETNRRSKVVAKKKKKKERREVGGLELRQKGRETDSDKWRKSPKLERQRSLSAETPRPLPGRALPPPHLALSPSAVPLRSGWLPGPISQPTRPSSVGIPSSRSSSRARFQPRGKGRGPVADERLRLARGRGCWPRAGRTPPLKAGPEHSQLERVEPRRCIWKGVGPDARG